VTFGLVGVHFLNDMNPKYIIGTGYFCKPDQPYEQFYPIWWENTWKYAKPERVIVLANGGCSILNAPGQWIPLSGNLGHVHDLNTHHKPYDFSGWSTAFCTLAMLAYSDECDFIFKEQDVLAFGPWVERMYSEIGKGGMIFGRSKLFPSCQSLVLIRHWFIPKFVARYLGSGSQQSKEQENELKFARFRKADPDLFKQVSFGHDRDRPFNVKDEVFYLQQIKGHEMKMLVDAGLLSADTPILENSWAPNLVK